MNRRPFILMLFILMSVLNTTIFCDQPKFPSTKDSLSQLIIPLQRADFTFSLGGKDTSMYSNSETFVGLTKPALTVHGTDSAYLWHNGYYYGMGRSVYYNYNLDQVLKIKPFNSSILRKHFTYATKLFLTMRTGTTSIGTGDTVLFVEVDMSTLTGETHLQTIPLRWGESYQIHSSNILNTTNFWKDWADGVRPGNLYTLAIPLDSNYFGYYIREIRLRFNKDYPVSHVVPSLDIFAVNLQTYIDVQAPVYFAQFDSLWGDSLLNNAITITTDQKKIRREGCVLTSYAMALRNLSIIQDSTGETITPKTLDLWLDNHNGYLNMTNRIIHNKIIEYANSAMNAGYNDNKSISIQYLRAPGLNDSLILIRAEEALANRYPLLLRVPRAPCTANNCCANDRHTILAYGLVPDFIGSYGTYKISDPGRGGNHSRTTLWRREACSQNYQGKWNYAFVVKPTDDITPLPSTLTLVLHSPGRLYVRSPDGLEVGFPSVAGSFINTFPDAHYYSIDPNENWNPEDTTLPEPPEQDSIQVLTIYNRPGRQPLTLKIIPTGNGPYELGLTDEAGLYDGRLKPVRDYQQSGILQIGNPIVLNIPPFDTIPPATPDVPEVFLIGPYIIVQWNTPVDNIGVKSHVLETKFYADSEWVYPRQIELPWDYYMSPPLICGEPQNRNSTTYFRIKAIDIAGNESNYSSAVRIVINGQNCVPAIVSIPAPSSPTLISPVNGASIQSANVTLRWSTSSGATSYRVKVFNGQTPVLNVATSSTNYQALGLLAGRTYTWSVEAIGEGGTNTSPSWTFTTQQQLPAGSPKGLLLLIIVLAGLGFIMLAKCNRLKYN